VKSPLYKHWLLLAGCAAVASLSFLGSRGLYETTEGRYAETAREMVETGNYLEPQLDYGPHWTKPPATYWAIAGGMKVLGRSSAGARLFGAAAFVLTVLAVARIGATLFGPEAGLMAGYVYAASPFPIYGAWTISCDTLLTLWEILAVCLYLAACQAAAPARRRMLIVGMWGMLGLAFFTKGPPGLIPLLPILVWRFTFGKATPLFNPLGLLCFAALGFWWFAVVCARHPDLPAYFLGKEVVGRVASDEVHNHHWYSPIELYLPVLTLGGAPWLFFLLKDLRRRGTRFPADAWRAVRAGGPAGFLLLWFALPMVVFALSSSRLHLYVLPIYAPIAILTSRLAWPNLAGAGRLKRAALTACVSVFVFALVKAVPAHAAVPRDMGQLYARCREFCPNAREVAVFEKNKMFGLQFYYGGKLTRVTAAGSEPQGEGSLAALVRAWAAKPDRGDLLIVTDRLPSGRSASATRHEELEALLRGWQAAFERGFYTDWALYRLSADAPPPRVGAAPAGDQTADRETRPATTP
jgi:4-amino-4-deoxy-L-arabinose transferase-like glycosyltransferase